MSGESDRGRWLWERRREEERGEEDESRREGKEEERRTKGEEVSPLDVAGLGCVEPLPSSLPTINPVLTP